MHTCRKHSPERLTEGTRTPSSPDTVTYEVLHLFTPEIDALARRCVGSLRSQHRSRVIPRVIPAVFPVPTKGAAAKVDTTAATAQQAQSMTRPGTSARRQASSPSLTPGETLTQQPQHSIDPGTLTGAPEVTIRRAAVDDAATVRALVLERANNPAVNTRLHLRRLTLGTNATAAEPSWAALGYGPPEAPMPCSDVMSTDVTVRTHPARTVRADGPSLRRLR